MLAQVMNVPRNALDWQVWSKANAETVRAINQAILNNQNVSLPDYVLDPINFSRLDLFLSWNEQAHRNFNGALGLQSSDIQTVDLTNPDQLATWVEIVYQELFDACNALEIGP